MKFIKYWSFVVMIASIGCSRTKNIASSSVDNNDIYLADPTIFPSDKNYYLYGTVEGVSDNGFIAYKSTDLTHWRVIQKDSGYVLRKGEAFGTAGFWAPQVFRHNNKYYMAYVANENIAIAESSSPDGPFAQMNKQALAAPVKQIDPFVFVDDDEKKYLYHVRLTGGNKIFVAQMEDDLSAIKPETLHECITATEEWENTAHAQWPVTEGPSVLKRNGVYYLFYTANDFRNPDYAVGYATSSSPLGPWKKYSGNPIITKRLLGVNGTGHGDFFRKENELFYVLHTHNGADKVAPRRTAMVKVHFAKDVNGMDKLVVEEKSFRYLYH